jgi:hypothetical protein
MVAITASQSVHGHVITIVWMGTPSTGTVWDGDQDLDFLTPRMHCYHHIDGCNDYCGISPLSKDG